MIAGKVLQGFSAALPTWEPTYRMQKGKAGSNFDTARIPSYCDRVLHRSMPGCSELLQLLRFDSAPEVASSDHKPIAADWLLAASPLEEISRRHLQLCLEQLVTRFRGDVQPVLKCTTFPEILETQARPEG
ncbi:IP5P15 [Symbiodinium pilosum]|uniref:IP5P15 protein n=1 Tax=Symbiodinium pilosum TaxID=2952 RepID=A0A812RN76_SYMPI|nr:IP5P15 [Symbiodinium pilosum]